MTTLQDFFKVSVFCSGTPAFYQRKIAECYSDNAIECPFKEAVENKWILKPTMNLIKASFEKCLPAAVKAVYERELELIKDNPELKNVAPRIIVNCNGIDEINALLQEEWFNQKMGKEFHIISIHSSKAYASKDGIVETLLPKIDGVDAKNSKEVMEKIQNNLDNNTLFPDNLPIILFQVDMISEGINLKSFSSTIITTAEERRAMQQIGRVVRKFNYSENLSKTNANVYVMFDNDEKLANLYTNLLHYNLTDECFDWGKQFTVSNSSTDKDNIPTSIAQLTNFKWDNIDSKSLEIVELQKAIDNNLEKEYQKKLSMEQEYIECVRHKFNYIFLQDKIPMSIFAELKSKYLDKEPTQKLYMEFEKTLNELDF